MEFLDRRAARILTVLVFAVGLAIVYVARAVLVVFAFAILFAYLIDPVVRFLQHHSLLFRSLRGPHVVEAYLAFVAAIFVLVYSLAPEFQTNAGRLLNSLPSIADWVSNGQIDNDLGSNSGWNDTQSGRVKTFLQQHRSMIESSVEQIGRFVSSVAAGIPVIPILAIFFLSDGENLANHIILLVSTKDNHCAVRTLAGQLHRMLQH